MTYEVYVYPVTYDVTQVVATVAALGNKQRRDRHTPVRPVCKLRKRPKQDALCPWPEKAARGFTHHMH